MKIVTLRIVKGKTPSYDANGKMLNENQTVKLEYGTLSWKNYMKNLIRNGFCKVTVEAVNEVQYTDKKNEIRDDKGHLKLKSVDTKAIDAEVQEVMKPAGKKMTIKEELAELKTLMLKTQAGNVKPLGEDGLAIDSGTVTAPVDNTPNVNEELEATRDRYLEVIGKKPHHMMQIKKMNELIEAKLA